MEPRRENAVVVIGGPTASGKSALALAIAHEFGGAIINADSMQLYNALPILTAQPSDADKAAAPHRLYGVLPPEQVGSAQLWREMALHEIGEATKAGHLPVVVGGTGLYLRTLMQGLSPMPDIPKEIRENVRRLWEEEGAHAVRARLEQVDPITAARLKPADKQRQLRALEIVQATGRPLSEWQKVDNEGAPTGLRFVTIVLRPEREGLRATIARRFEAMVEQGALEEAKALLACNLPADRPILRAVGLPQLAEHLAGNVALDQAISGAVTATRQYAKRQDTWFRHKFIADKALLEQFSEKFLPEIFSLIRQSGLTP